MDVTLPDVSNAKYGLDWTSEDHAFVRKVLGQFERYLVEMLGYSPADAARLSRSEYATTHRHYLIIFYSFAESSVGLALAKDTLIDLSVAAYAVMRMAVAIDKAVDDGDTGAMRFAMDNQQLILRLLVRHLPHTPDLWLRHNSVMSRYWRIADLERCQYPKHCQEALAILDEVQWYKSCPLHVVLDWIDSLASGRVPEIMYRTLDQTSKVWQVLDDIDDFQEDVQKGQLTLLAYEVSNWCDLHGIDFAAESPERKLRLLYLSPVIDRHVDEALGHAQSAIDNLCAVRAGHWVQPVMEALRLLQIKRDDIAAVRRAVSHAN